MTCETVYKMAAKYLTACRQAQDTVTTTGEVKTEQKVQPADQTVGDSDTTTKVTEEKTVTKGFEDPEEYVLPILNSAAYEMAWLADEYCRQKGMVKGRFIFTEAASLSDPLPLPDRFAPAASFYLAATLCLPLDTAMASAMQGRFEGALESIRQELTAVITPVKEVYPPSASFPEAWRDA